MPVNTFIFLPGQIAGMAGMAGAPSLPHLWHTDALGTPQDAKRPLYLVSITLLCLFFCFALTIVTYGADRISTFTLVIFAAVFTLRSSSGSVSVPESLGLKGLTCEALLETLGSAHECFEH